MVVVRKAILILMEKCRGLHPEVSIVTYKHPVNNTGVCTGSHKQGKQLV